MAPKDPEALVESFVEAATNPLLAGALAADTEARLDRLNTPAGDRDMLAILIGYRTGDRPDGAEVLLAALAPWLITKLSTLRPLPPLFSARDLSQQLVLEVLETALTMPIGDDSRHVARRLVRRARWQLVRRLRREWRLQGLFEPLPEDDGDDDDSEEV